MVAKVVATAFGGPEVLAIIDEEVGEPGPGQVLLEVRAAGTNPVDYKLYGGARGRDPSLLPDVSRARILGRGSRRRRRRRRAGGSRSMSATRSSPSVPRAPTPSA